MPSEDSATVKIPWTGRLASVQPRIRLSRSFDQRNHSYLGYILRVDGAIGDQAREFLIGIGKVVQAKHEFQAGDLAEGECLPVADSQVEPAEFYKASKLKILERSNLDPIPPPLWLGIPKDLETYRQPQRKPCRTASTWHFRRANAFTIEGPGG